MTEIIKETVASIDVGSNFLQMMIAEIDSEGSVRQLEDLWQPTSIGRDTFSCQRVSIASINHACDTLKGFAQLMKDYRVQSYRAVSTSGIREADNREYVLEQIRLRTGLNVEMINSSEERFIIYKALRDSLPEVKGFRYPGFLIVNIGMGGMEATVYSEGYLRYTEYIKAGSLRLRQMLNDLERITLDFPGIVEEFLESKIYALRPRITQLNIKSFVGLGGELETIAELCVQKKLSTSPRFISRKALAALYREIRNMTTEQISFEYELHRNEADILMPSIIIFNSFLEMTKAEGIHVPGVSLRHGILASMVDEAFDTSRKQDFQEDIISSVWFLCETYGVDIKHTRQIRRMALSIFDQTRSIHKLTARERLLLEVASILHDVGHHLNAIQHQVHSYHIIKSSDILSFSNRDLALIANIARYHSEDIPKPSHANYSALEDADKIKVSKLAAILKLAESLDVSHQQKIQEIDIHKSKRDLIISVHTGHDILLEDWSVRQHCDFFEEVTGFHPILKRKGM